MNALSITTLIAVLTLVQGVQAQEAIVSNPPVDAEFGTVSAQISSPTNYSLLAPIASKPDAVTSLLEPKSRPLVPISTKVESKPASPVSKSDSKSIKVTPLSFKSGEFDQHAFKIHNPTSKTLRQARVLLKAPAGSSVQQVIPKPDSVDGANVLLSVGELQPGEEKIVEVMIEYPNNELARFDSIVLSEKWGNAPGVVAKPAMVREVSTASPLPSGASLLKPMEPQASGMLKPKVPARTVSATTKVQVETLSPALTRDVKALPAEQVVELASKNESDAALGLDGFSGIKSALQGPANVSVGQETEFSIELKNYSSKTADSVVVQLTVPQRLKVTVLDRAAWYDGENRKISWKVSSMEAKSTETIRFKAVAKSAGAINQDVVIGMDDRVESACSLSTTAR